MTMCSAILRRSPWNLTRVPGSQLADGAGERRRDLHRGLVGHYLHQVLATLHNVSRLDQPGDQLRLVDPLAQLGQTKFHDTFPLNSATEHTESTEKRNAKDH